MSLLDPCLSPCSRGSVGVALADRMGCLKGGVVDNVVVPSPDYVRFAIYYRFRPDFCHANDPESKGIVENLVGYAKDDLLIPLELESDPWVDGPGGLNPAGIRCRGIGARRRPRRTGTAARERHVFGASNYYTYLTRRPGEVRQSQKTVSLVPGTGRRRRLAAPGAGGSPLSRARRSATAATFSGAPCERWSYSAISSPCSRTCLHVVDEPFLRPEADSPGPTGAGSPDGSARALAGRRLRSSRPGRSRHRALRRCVLRRGRASLRGSP